jgi:hypothetical protein
VGQKTSSTTPPHGRVMPASIPMSFLTSEDWIFPFWLTLLVVVLDNLFFNQLTSETSHAHDHSIQLIIKRNAWLYTLIPPLSTWINNIGDSGESVVGPNFLNNIIGPSRQGWDKNGMRVYNQAFLNN